MVSHLRQMLIAFWLGAATACPAPALSPASRPVPTADEVARAESVVRSGAFAFMLAARVQKSAELAPDSAPHLDYSCYLFPPYSLYPASPPVTFPAQVKCTVETADAATSISYVLKTEAENGPWSFVDAWREKDGIRVADLPVPSGVFGVPERCARTPSQPPGNGSAHGPSLPTSTESPSSCTGTGRCARTLIRLAFRYLPPMTLW